MSIVFERCPQCGGIYNVNMSNIRGELHAEYGETYLYVGRAKYKVCTCHQGETAPPKGLTVAVQDIWLMREGGENDLAHTVVYVKMEGVWYEAIRELADSNFSHCISAYGLTSGHLASASWLNNAEQTKEQGNG